MELQNLTGQTGLQISICNQEVKKIEHRLVSFISKNWRGKPLVSHQVIVNLIAATTTRIGLRVRAELDPGKYFQGIKVSNKALSEIRLARDPFYGEWNDAILPRTLMCSTYREVSAAGSAVSASRRGRNDGRDVLILAEDDRPLTATSEE